jgi:hypothetical protein
VLNDTSGKYEGLRTFLRNELKTGTFDLAIYFLAKIGAHSLIINYDDMHSAIADDELETHAGNYAARIAELILCIIPAVYQ